jgi:crotonobetainyl-CoA:carnitine CoA-transferase CaiB-like acyl-CoA transferase
MILGDLGADVIKIEKSGVGDETRTWGPPFDERGESAYFLSCNRNKLSLAVDLALDDDRALVRRLIAGADVVLDNFRPRMLAARGLDPSALLAEHTRLVWCTITGFGPDSDRPGYDYVVQAESGWMSITGEVSGEPMKVGVALADVITGKDAVIAVLAMLAGGRRGGPADRHLVVSLQHSATSALVNVAQNALVTGRDATRWGNAHPNLVPYEMFPTADRPIVIAVGSDAQFAALARALDSAELGDDRFTTNPGRVAHRNEVVGAIRARLARHPASAWIERLARAGVPCAVVRTVLEALDEVHASPVSGVAPLPPASVRRPPPRLGEHGDLIRALGWSAVARV